MKRKLFLLIIFILANCLMHAQPLLDVINIKYQSFPNQYYKGNDLKRTGREFDVIALAPLVQKDSNAILVGAFLRRINSNDPLRPFSLYSCGLNIGYNYNWKNKRWIGTALFIPKISSDEFSLRGKNVQYGGAVLLKYRKSPKMQYQFGLYYNRELFGNYFIPLAGINWRPSKRINVYGILPATFNFEYKINPAFYTGISYSTLTSTSTLHGDLGQYYLKEGEKKVGNTQLRLILNWYILKNIVVFFEPGITYKRVFNLYTYDKEKFPFDSSGSLSSIKDGFFLMGGVAYRIRFDK